MRFRGALAQEPSCGNLTATQWIPDGPGVEAVVWHAMARLVDGSWNQAVLLVPLDETPTGTKLGLAIARICDCADGSSASVRAAPEARATAM
jgi:hypothetical protein